MDFRSRLKSGLVQLIALSKGEVCSYAFNDLHDTPIETLEAYLNKGFLPSFKALIRKPPCKFKFVVRQELETLRIDIIVS